MRIRAKRPALLDVSAEPQLKVTVTSLPAAAPARLLSPNRIVWALGAAIAALAAMHVTVIVAEDWSWRLYQLFHLDMERNIPTWFASGLWAFSALVALGCADASSSRDERQAWSFVAICLLALSCDEVAGLHEQIGAWMFSHGFTTKLTLLNVPYQVSVPFAMLVSAAVYQLFWRYVRVRLASGVGRRWLWAAGVAGAVTLIDVITDGRSKSMLPIPARVALPVLEEAGELVVSLLVLSGLLRQFASSSSHKTGTRA